LSPAEITPARSRLGAMARALGADPAVFVPFLRAYALIVRRRSRMRLARGISPKAMGRISPFHVACFFAGLLGVGLAFATAGMQPSQLGAALGLTIGAFLIVFAVLFDYLEILASPDEYRVIAAHPHDAWSVLLAKLFVVGRALATLAACFYTPSVLALGIARHSLLAASAYALGAIGVTVVAALGSMLAGIAILARFGRVALLRFLPVIQGLFLAGYFSMSMGRRWVAASGIGAGGALPWWVTFAPPVWFAAPLEAATGTAVPATAIRALLAAASLAFLGGICVRWGRTGFGEALLAYGSGAPRASAPKLAARRALRAARSRRAPMLRDPSTRAYLSIARIHLRTDLAFRSQIVMSTVAPALMFLSPAISVGSRRSLLPEVTFLLGAAAIGVAIVGLMTSSASSMKPAALWPLLTSPVERAPFALAPRRLLRWFLVLPVVVVGGGWYLAAAATVPPVERIARVLGVAIYLDMLVTLQRGLMPEMPFSVRPNRDRQMPWSQVLAMLVGFAVGGGGGFGLFLMWMIRGWGAWVAVGALLAWRMLLEPWTRWRVRRAVGALEAV
jgi:hypothetical protein